MPQPPANAGTTATILKRVVGVGNLPITVISIDTLTRRMVAVNPTPPNQDLGTDTLDPSDCIFDSPQTDEGWTGTLGYNFRDRVVVPACDRLFIEYTFIDTDGNPIIETEVIPVVPMA